MISSLLYFSCEYDYLSIYDGQDWYAPKLGTWCGTGSIPTILSSTRYLYIEFVTDDAGREDGFRMKYEFFKPDLCMYIYIVDDKTRKENTDKYIFYGKLKCNLSLI